MYGVVLMPLTTNVRQSDVTQKWYVNNVSAAGSLESSDQLLNKVINHGKHFSKTNGTDSLLLSIEKFGNRTNKKNVIETLSDE